MERKKGHQLYSSFIILIEDVGKCALRSVGYIIFILYSVCFEVQSLMLAPQCR